jgi:hypothetical protein
MHGHKDPKNGKVDTCKGSARPHGLTAGYFQGNIKFHENLSISAKTQ